MANYELGKKLWELLTLDRAQMWDAVPDELMVHYDQAARALLEWNRPDSAQVAPPILRVARPYIPTIDIFGTVYELKHPLLNDDQTRKKVQALSDKYIALRQAANENAITPELERDMQADMGNLISIFVPGLPKDDLALLVQGDRYRILGACFKAYEEIFEEIAERNVAEDKPTPEMETVATPVPE